MRANTTTRISEWLRSNVLGLVAIFIALSGTAYATHPGGANTISSGDIINGEVKGGDIGDFEVRAADVAPDSLGGAKIANGSVKNADLSIGASSSNTIADGGIQSIDLAPGSVQSSDLDSESVGSEKLATDAIPADGNIENASTKLATGSVGFSELAQDSVDSSRVVDDSLSGTDINESGLNLAAEGSHEVGAPGEPGFNSTTTCSWSNATSAGEVNAFGQYNPAAFLRDRHGFVHLKGLVDADDVGDGCDFSFLDTDLLIFTLPQGYRPAKREVHVTSTNFDLGQVVVEGLTFPIFGEGGIAAQPPVQTEANAKEWISLDGISFRCAPSGANGCP